MEKINREEYEVLKELDDKWKWIARDRDDSLYAFEKKPYKHIRTWLWRGNHDFRIITEAGFRFIQWEDEKPYNIAELIKEYESEETEVKTLESIREEIWEEMLRLEDKRKDRWADIKYQTLREVLQKLGHLDEPEVLSEDWIYEKAIDTHVDTINGDIQVTFKLEDLQNLLVAKQEKVEVPRFVADILEENTFADLPTAFEELFSANAGHYYGEDVCKWIVSNEETFARAWLDGFTVEKEPLYRARLKVITDEFIASYLRTQSSDAEGRLKALEIGSKYIHEDYRHLSEFTEDELKRLDIWDSEQWEVEELEE